MVGTLRRLLPLLIFLLVWCSPPLHAGVGRPDPEQGPTEVQIQIFVLDLDEIDSANQNFSANVFFEALWRDPRLATDPAGGIQRRPLSEIWHPRLQVLNQQRLWSTMAEEAEIQPDGTVVFRQRAWGSFSQPLNLKEFPFDRQALSIQLVAADYLTEQVELVATVGSGVSDTLSIADWKVVNWEMAADAPVPSPPGAKHEIVPSVALVLHVERRIGYYVIKVILPLLLIVAMSWVVFWIDPRDFGTKVSVAITAMLTLIAYRFAVGATLPNVSYLTRLDLFIMVSTVLIYASLVVVVVTSHYARTDRPGAAKRIDRWVRWLAPLVFLVVAVGTLYLGFGV